MTDLRQEALDFMAKMQEALDRFKPHTDDQGRHVIVLSGDYSPLEARILAQVIRESGPPLVFELGQTGGQIPAILGESHLLRGVRAAKKAVKQNGRSAAYLRHDPTKNGHHRRMGSKAS